MGHESEEKGAAEEGSRKEANALGDRQKREMSYKEEKDGRGVGIWEVQKWEEAEMWW